jgi:hypothetical protein
VFKLKRDEARAIVKHNARLVARGFVQREGIDFDDTFTPVARMESVRLLFALTAQEGWRVHHMDIKSAFLNGDLKDEVYVHQPSGFAIPGMEGKVLRLRKTLYGLRQAPRAWNVKLDSTLKGMGFGQCPHKAAIYRRGNGGNALLVGVYVDDLVITGTKDAEVAAFKEEMKATFQMSDLGLLSFYLGIEVHQGDSGITLRQTAYAKRVVELAGLTDYNPSLTLMEERLKLNCDGTTEVDATQYRRLVGTFATSPTHDRTWHSPLATLVGSCSDQRRSISRLRRESSAMLQGVSTTASTTRGALGRHTLLGTATVTTPATSTPARARAGSLLLRQEPR